MTRNTNSFITICYQDDWCCVLNKPAGVVVNRSQTTKEDTVQDWVEKNSIINNTGDFSDDFYLRSGVVHRLDKNTSGLLLIAKSTEAFSNLQEQFKTRTIVKEYKALVHDRVVPNLGSIDAPIGRLPWNRERFGVFAGGKSSHTDYKVDSYHLDLKGLQYSLISVFPKTGRTHQIRVHFQYLKTPIVSDPFYAGKKRYKKDVTWCPRIFLHAGKITFYHAVLAKRITVEAPLPKDLADALEKLHKDPLNLRS